ncbi:RDD family protein [soil metagenome]
MSSISIDTTQNVVITYEVADVMERIIAIFIDGIIITSVGFVFLFIAVILTSGDDAEFVNRTIVTTVAATLAFLYPLIAEATMNGQTLGKRAMGIRVVRRDGLAANLGNFVIRYLLGLIEIGATTGSIALVCILVTKDRQRLGDLAAGTIVVKVAKKASLQFAQLRTAEDGIRPIMFEEVGSLTENDVAIIREVLRATRDRAYTIEVRTNMAYKAKERIESMLHITSELGAEKFLLQVLEDHGTLHAHLPAISRTER